MCKLWIFLAICLLLMFFVAGDEENGIEGQRRDNYREGRRDPSLKQKKRSKRKKYDRRPDPDAYRNIRTEL